MKNFERSWIFIVIIGMLSVFGIYSETMADDCALCSCAISTPLACTDCVVEITVTAVPCKTYRNGTITLSSPLTSFPSWREETRGEPAGANPIAVLADKLENVQLERFYFSAGSWHNQKSSTTFYTQNGRLIVKKTFTANPGNFIQLLATTWDDLQYELAIDDPGKKPGIDQSYCLNGLVEIAKLHDGTWGFKIK